MEGTNIMAKKKKVRSTIQPGNEEYKTVPLPDDAGSYIEYLYRHPDGRIYATDAPSLKIARQRRDNWLKEGN